MLSTIIVRTTAYRWLTPRVTAMVEEMHLSNITSCSDLFATPCNTILLSKPLCYE